MKTNFFSLIIVAVAALGLLSCNDQKEKNALAYSALRFESPSLTVNMTDSPENLVVNYLNGHYAPPSSDHSLGTPEVIVIDEQKTTAEYGKHFTIEGYNAEKKSIEARYDNNEKGNITIKLIKANITSQLTIVLKPFCDLPEPSVQTQIVTINPAQ